MSNDNGASGTGSLTDLQLGMRDIAKKAKELQGRRPRDSDSR